MRYIRFFVRFAVGDYDKDSLLPHIPHMNHLSKERIVKEMESMCKGRNTSRGFEIMNELGISKMFFGGDLVCNIDDSLSAELKMAYGLYDIKISHWPINKNVKRIHSLRVPNGMTNEEYMAYIWHKYKDLHVLQLFNDVLQYHHQQPIHINDNIDLSVSAQFEGRNRGIAELLIRYYHIMGISYDYSKVNECKSAFYEHIISKVK